MCLQTHCRFLESSRNSAGDVMFWVGDTNRLRSLQSVKNRNSVQSWDSPLCCVMCRTDRVTLVDTYQYNDSAEDAFQREPYCVKFRLHGTGVSTQ